MKIFLILLFFIWIGVVLYSYFKGHYSYMALFLSKNNIFDELFLLFLLALLSYALGRRIFLLFRFKFHSLLEEFIFASGIGLVTLGYIMMILLILVWVLDISWMYIYGLIIGISLLLVKDILIIVKIMLERIKSALTLKFTTFSIILWFLLGIGVFLTLIMALAPPFESQPKISLSPFILGISLNSEILVKLLHFYFGILIIIGIFALVNRHFHPGSGLLVSSIFYIIFLAGTSKIELQLVFYELLAVYSFLCWVDSNKKAWFLIMVITIGIALLTNYHGIYCLVGLIPLILYHCLVKRSVSLIKFIFTYIIIQLLIGFGSKEFLPLLPLLAIFISHFIYNYLKEYTLLRKAIFCVITLSFILILSYEFYVIFNHYAPLKFIFGLETAAEYIARITHVY